MTEGILFFGGFFGCFLTKIVDLKYKYIKYMYKYFVFSNIIMRTTSYLLPEEIIALHWIFYDT